MNKRDWSQFGEADVREEIIAPLLLRLNYQTGTDNNIIREQSLRYDKSYLGHKKPNKDWPLRGKADYICEVKKKIRWTIEAKSPSREISTEDIEQSYTYARHPEVRAVYFCICNGRELKIYQTADAPGTKPILSLKYEDFDNSFHAIESLLGPDSILRNHPETTPDFGQPIGPGLRSLVRITGGRVVFQTCSPDLPMFKGYTVFVISGAVQRQASVGLVAFLDTLSPYESLQRLNERLGIDKFEITSSDPVLSTDERRPTIFQSEHTVFFAKGEVMPNFLTGTEIRLPTNLTCKVKTLAEGVLKNNIFTGKFQAIYFYQESGLNFSMHGEFEIQVV